ncbi:MAG: hypothetical protein V1788_01460 [Nanoarchaeota archaeon]|nr:hypothetical protein [Nanoarchaeota archaeon]
MPFHKERMQTYRDFLASSALDTEGRAYVKTIYEAYSKRYHQLLNERNTLNTLLTKLQNAS